MDSKRLNPEQYTGIKRKLAFIENKLYKTIHEPDIVFYLKVPVAVAVQRNDTRIKDGKESEEFLRIRHNENKNLIYINPDFKDLDFYSFNKVDEFVELWYIEAKKQNI